ncbi:YMFI-like protein [Mya arenaria]|uniref:YMFI-like protein n=1 Tax=Mya arenaria TaxID=6604 RepID=A0ABY7FDP7_MYAAR|nr:YMFI-like protein [Mya arenaria]
MESLKGYVCLITELAPHGVRVNSINPGLVATTIFRSNIGPKDSDDYTKLMDAEATVHPLGRIGLPVDCARAVAFLASKAASFTTGQIFFIDGGRHCVTAVNVGMQ